MKNSDAKFQAPQPSPNLPAEDGLFVHLSHYLLSRRKKIIRGLKKDDHYVVVIVK